MTEVDIWADDMRPEVRFVGIQYGIRLSNKKIIELRQTDQFKSPYAYVTVEEGGLLMVEDNTYFNGMKFRDMTWEQRRDVYDWLIEWELAEWRRIGPEDSELFATDKLTDGSR